MSDIKLKKKLWIRVFAAAIERSGVIDLAEFAADKALEIYAKKDFDKRS